MNCTVSPGLTLIEVANPWIVVDPEPVICQSLVGSPVWVFSHAITLTTGGPQGSAAAAMPVEVISNGPIPNPAAAAPARMAAPSRPERRAGLTRPRAH